MINTYKSSFYNITIPITETQETLLYNTIHGGVVILNKQETSILDKIINLNYINNDNTPLINSLISNKYLIDSSINELEEYINRKQTRRTKRFKGNVGSIGLTIAPTSNCNMACPYCFEFDKPNHSLSNSLLNNIEDFIYSIIKNNCHVTEWKQLGINWYGGEPLIGITTIKELTPKLLKIADKYHMKYEASIVTNGILLTQENWNILKENKITDVQVTIDGIKNIHNKHRPLRNKNRRNYEQILENLSKIPEGISVVIRTNTDKEVVDNFDAFLRDLECYQIWPQQYKKIKLAPARLRTYPNTDEKDLSNRIPRNVWDITRLNLNELIYNYFNNWANKNNIKKANFKYHYPLEKYGECGTVISPYNFIIGADGFLYKCWEHIHEENKKIHHIQEGYQKEKYTSYLSFNKFERCSESNTCKFLPLCEYGACLATDKDEWCLNNQAFIDELKNKYVKVKNVKSEESL